MKILYKCSCMKQEAEVKAPDRRLDEDIVDWVESRVGIAIAAHHQLHSPLCMRTKMEYIKIPVPDEQRGIGFKPQVN